MPAVLIRTAFPEEIERVHTTYASWGYFGDVEPNHIVLIAERGSEWLGLLRLSHESGIHMLRGMQVAPGHRQQGIGTRLLSAFIHLLADRECYCIPYRHLDGFYGRAGFQVLQTGNAPEFLRERLALYAAQGLDTIVMRRPLQTLPRRNPPEEGHPFSSPRP